ncbi:MAG: Rab family GTPase [Promethearchaeota archaeon]
MWAAQKDVEYAFKIVILGAGGVGKTCLFNRYCFNSFNMNTEMTIGINFHSTYLKIQMEDRNYHPPDQEKFVANSIFDMSGQDKFKSLIKKFIDGASGALLVFDSINFTSFQQLDYWYQQIRDNALNPDIPIILVASKSDLLNKTPEWQQVKEDLIQDYIKKRDLNGFYKTSALENYNVLEVFKELTTLMLNFSGFPAYVI